MSDWSSGWVRTNRNPSRIPAPTDATDSTDPFDMRAKAASEREDDHGGGEERPRIEQEGERGGGCEQERSNWGADKLVGDCLGREQSAVCGFEVAFVVDDGGKHRFAGAVKECLATAKKKRGEPHERDRRST